MTESGGAEDDITAFGRFATVEGSGRGRAHIALGKSTKNFRNEVFIQSDQKNTWREVAVRGMRHG